MMGLSSERGTGSLSGNPTSHRLGTLKHRDYGCSLLKTRYKICIIDVSKEYNLSIDQDYKSFILLFLNILSSTIF